MQKTACTNHIETCAQTRWTPACSATRFGLVHSPKLDALLQLRIFQPMKAAQTKTGQTKYELSAPPSNGLAHVFCASANHLVLLSTDSPQASEGIGPDL